MGEYGWSTSPLCPVTNQTGQVVDTMQQSPMDQPARFS
jgi:hypothetical protein